MLRLQARQGAVAPRSVTMAEQLIVLTGEGSRGALTLISLGLIRL